MITEPLSNNGRLAPTPLLRLSGVMSQYICITVMLRTRSVSAYPETSFKKRISTVLISLFSDPLLNGESSISEWLDSLRWINQKALAAHL
jgi:hypothetical protein